MTKGQLDGIRDYWLSLTMPAYSIHQDTVLDGREILSSAQQDIRKLIEALEPAWAERAEAIMEGLRLTKLLEKAERDAMTLTLRLMGESDESFAPETREVMTRWRVKCLKLIGEIERGSTP